eukprot:TRINITY_DN6015_c0_g1_i1.p1 TRINITY_DN6015_c0_g1~~TRINITY_DN6015_c0_g1_i1.p1  ORF type:complete len:259 (-),score=149.16 TRINITY_DN6015_c0_g1_i1:1-777(-)
MSKVIVEEIEDILIISISRPEVRNAVDFETADLLYSQFKRFDSNPKFKVAILTGEQGNFCSGADLKNIANANNQNINVIRIEGDFAPMGPSRLLLSKPVIAAIPGFAVAGGLELALWCDLRICETNTIFGVYCRRWGVPLIDGGTIRLSQIIGLGRALEMILTARDVNAQDALNWGLVNQVVEIGQAKNEAIKLAQLICKFPQQCLRSDRLSCYTNLNALSIEQALQTETKFGIPNLTQLQKTTQQFFQKKQNLQSKL